MSIQDTAANLKVSLADLETMATAGVITGIALTDTKAPTLSFSRTEVSGVLSDATNEDVTVKLLQKITSSFVLNVTDAPDPEASTTAGQAPLAIGSAARFCHPPHNDRPAGSGGSGQASAQASRSMIAIGWCWRSTMPLATPSDDSGP